MVRKYHHFLFLFLMTRYMRFSLKCIWHTLLSSNITENLKLLWLCLLSGEKSGYMMLGQTTRISTNHFSFALSDRGLVLRNNFPDQLALRSWLRHYKFNLKRAPWLPLQQKSPVRTLTSPSLFKFKSTTISTIHFPCSKCLQMRPIYTAIFCHASCSRRLEPWGKERPKVKP